MIRLDADGFMQDLAVDFFDSFAIERPRIQLLHARENFLFARGDAQRDAAGAFQTAYFESETRAHVEQVQQSGVNRVNFRAPIANFDFALSASPFASSAENDAKNKKGRVSLAGRGRLERLGAVLVAKCWVIRARLAGPLPRIREAVGKSETVIKPITHAPCVLLNP